MEEDIIPSDSDPEAYQGHYPTVKEFRSRELSNVAGPSTPANLIDVASSRMRQRSPGAGANLSRPQQNRRLIQPVHLDQEKAYDRVNLTYLTMVLHQFGFAASLMDSIPMMPYR